MRYKEILEACWTGYKQAGMKKKGDRMVPNCVPMTETRRDSEDLYQPTDRQLDRLHHEFIPGWSMLDHDQLTTAYDFVDDDTAMQFVRGLDDIEQSMDHNAVVTIDNARVTVAVRTGDVDGLTRLDFEFALRVQVLAQKLDGDQTPHATNQVEEDLRKWFKEKWVRFGPDGKIRGDCARGSDTEGKPKCLPQSKAHALGKKGRASSAAKKRREDPNPERRGPAKNVATKVKEDDLDEACWKGYHKDGMKTMFGKRYPNCVKNKNEDANDAEISQPNILDLLRSWRNRVPAQYAWHLTKTFGDPHDATEDLVIWHDRDGFKRIEIKDEYVMHISPSPHYDYCYSYIDLRVPHRLSSALANCSESILIDHLKNEVGARCASLAANAVTLNFVMDVVAGRTQPSRDEYEKRIMDMHHDFEHGKIFSIEWWPDQTYDTDPANPYYRKQHKSKAKDKSQPSNTDMAEDKRISRKAGQPANSKKHSDLYTDENPQGTITGLKFATADDARASVSRIRKSGRSHAHKVQAAVAMEQRARAAGKASAAAVYRAYINSVKKTDESLQVYVNRGECPGCGGVMVSEDQINEKQDACYHKVKSRYKVWPSAYASGALVRCRKVGAKNWGNKSKK